VNQAETFEPHSIPSFRERVHSLAGRTTYREPMGGYGTTASQIPSDHIIAAALSFGRRDRGDIGPDIAFDIATGRPGHYRQVCAWLGRQIIGDRTASVARMRPWAAHVSVASYNAVVRGWHVPEAPIGATAKDWGSAVILGCLLLQYAADDALALAARRNRGDG
jgi:hypothetical protein